MYIANRRDGSKFSGYPAHTLLRFDGLEVRDRLLALYLPLYFIADMTRTFPRNFRN